MEQKIGEAFFHDMVDRGRRELGGVMFEGSNVAQPQYPLRGSYGPPKQLDGPEPSGIEPGAEEPHLIEASRGDPGREDRDLDRE
jgi:hypothetical protein